ncbi:flagellar basal body rod protein FlgB [Soehngenia saccharolytica]|nr:flagellar basal body rod protein FlgB [Soehngenia saccharolytica]
MSDISYQLIKKGLDVSSLRQKTISSNIANANTPNYKVNKVEFEEHLQKAIKGVSLIKTDGLHFGASKASDVEPIVKKRTNTMYNDNGNNVDIDLEMTELAANEIYYSALTQIINAKLSSLNYVINR